MQIRQWVNHVWSERSVRLLIQPIGLSCSDRTYRIRLTFAKRFCLQKYCKVNISDHRALSLLLSLSPSLSLSFCIIVKESRCCRPNYHTAESTKNFTLSMPPPPLRPLNPSFYSKSLNDSHASDTPPSLFFTTCTKDQGRKIKRRAVLTF